MMPKQSLELGRRVVADSYILSWDDGDQMHEIDYVHSEYAQMMKKWRELCAKPASTVWSAMVIAYDEAGNSLGRIMNMADQPEGGAR